MADVTVKRLDELPAFGQGVFIAGREALGVSSFGINVERWPPNNPGHPSRKLLPGDEGVTVLCLGAVPDGTYVPSGPV